MVVQGPDAETVLQREEALRPLVAGLKQDCVISEAQSAADLLPSVVTQLNRRAALPDDLALYVDAPIMELPEIILGGGSRSLKILVSPEVLRKMPNVKIIDGLSLPPRES